MYRGNLGAARASQPTPRPSPFHHCELEETGAVCQLGGILLGHRSGLTVLFFAWSLWALVGACSAAPRSQVAGGAAADAPPCQSPDQEGCAECCEQQYGPTPDDLLCNQRAAAVNAGTSAKGHGYAEQPTLVTQGQCPTHCRSCAACTSDREASYRLLLSRGCDCLDPFVRDIVRGLDPCFTNGCGCTCSLLSELSACGPK